MESLKWHHKLKRNCSHAKKLIRKVIIHGPLSSAIELEVINAKCQNRRRTMADKTTTSSTLFPVTNTRFAESLTAAWHQREARFALRYQTHLTVFRLISISRVDGRGAGVGAFL